MSLDKVISPVDLQKVHQITVGSVEGQENSRIPWQRYSFMERRGCVKAILSINESSFQGS